ncbi:Transcription regulation protein, GntR family [gamma proteobacterium HdN1]|nr:Transcription regulation protein, GntR family [gamma proteobacterium HdN1]
MSKISTVDSIVEALAFRIAAGIYGAGEPLPSVRKLAEEFAVNPSTVKVIVAQLEAAGFISCHNRVGMIVKDIDKYGGIQAWRYMFRFAQKLPDRAVKILRDILEIRGDFIEKATRKISANPQHYDPAPVRAVVDRLCMLVAEPEIDIKEFCKAELHAARMTMIAIDQSVITAIYNSIGEILLEIPAVVEAMYSNPRVNAMVWMQLVTDWEKGQSQESFHLRFSEFLKEYDKFTLMRFKEIILAENGNAVKKD